MSRKMCDLTFLEAIEAILEGYRVTYQPPGCANGWYELRGSHIVFVAAGGRTEPPEMNTREIYHIVGPPAKLLQADTPPKLEKPVCGIGPMGLMDRVADVNVILRDVYKRGWDACWEGVVVQITAASKTNETNGGDV